MKTLYLIRHAKSDWSNPLQSDFDRPLNKRGNKDAPFMGNILAKTHIHPDLILSSPAARAKKTAVDIAKQINYNTHSIRYDKTLHEADIITIEHLLKSISPSQQTVFLQAPSKPHLDILGFEFF